MLNSSNFGPNSLTIDWLAELCRVITSLRSDDPKREKLLSVLTSSLDSLTKGSPSCTCQTRSQGQTLGTESEAGCSSGPGKIYEATEPAQPKQYKITPQEVSAYLGRVLSMKRGDVLIDSRGHMWTWS